MVNKKFLLDKEIYIQDVTEDVIDYISSIVGKNFKEDMLLKTSVALFLNSSLVRVRFGFQIHNPFLDEIKQRYPAIFSACFTSSQVYEKLIGQFPSEDEIAYMAVLFEGAMEEKKRNINTAIVGSGGMANLVIKPAVVIMKCAQRTEWQDGCVDIVFLLALNFEDIQSTRAFFSSFYEMTMEKNTTFLIRKAETEEEIMNVIMNSMNETEE